MLNIGCLLYYYSPIIFPHLLYLTVMSVYVELHYVRWAKVYELIYHLGRFQIDPLINFYVYEWFPYVCYHQQVDRIKGYYHFTINTWFIYAIIMFIGFCSVHHNSGNILLCAPELFNYLETLH